MDERGIVPEAKKVSKIYGANRAEAERMMAAGHTKEEVHQKTGAAVALWDVSFQVQRGEVFSIIVLSGSGKSTIIRCFNQLLKPTGEHVYFEGSAVDTMGRKELLKLRRSKVSMVFQNFGLFIQPRGAGERGLWAGGVRPAQGPVHGAGYGIY